MKRSLAVHGISSIPFPWIFSLVAFLLAASLFGLLPGEGDRSLGFAPRGAFPEPAQFLPPPGSRKLSSGEYQIFASENSGGVGPFASQVYDFREYWTLWRLASGELLAEGEQEFDSPRDVHHSNRFEVRLSPSFQLLSLKDYARLRWRPDSGPLTCEFRPKELVCSSGAKNPLHEAGLDLVMKHPYGFLWPISAFSISNITRSIAPSEGIANPVQLVTIEEPSPANPVLPTVLDGRLRYLGQQAITVAGQKWTAQKFSLKVPFTPPLLIWTTSKGLLLAFGIENARKTVPEEGMKLVHYQQWADE